MKHVGKILKKHIETHRLVKGQVAKKAGISYNYLSTIFKQDSVDAGLLERLCVASGLHPGVFFDIPEEIRNNYSDIWANTLVGSATVQINANDNLKTLLDEKDKILKEKERIIEEKERTIQILLSQVGISVPGQNRDNTNN